MLWHRFWALFGSWDVREWDWISSILLFIYGTFSNVTMVNIFVAMLSDTYSNVSANRTTHTVHGSAHAVHAFPQCTGC